MKFLVLSLLAVVLVAVNAPVAHAQSDILASATRLASTVELEQDEAIQVIGFFSRPKQYGGIVIAAVGSALLAIGPRCGSTGKGLPEQGVIKYTYSDAFRNGKCDIAVDVNIDTDAIEEETRRHPFIGVPDRVFFEEGAVAAFKSYPGSFVLLGSGSFREYHNDVVQSEKSFLVGKKHFEGVKITGQPYLPKWGWGALVGGIALWLWGTIDVERQTAPPRLSVDSPFRVGVTPDGGILATRSLSW